MRKLSRWVGVVGLAAGIAAVIAVVSHVPAVAFAAGASRFAGELSKPLDALSGAELTGLVAHLRFTGGTERTRFCSGTPECDSGSARTAARIEAVDQAPISASNIPVDGVIISRIENTGNFTERRYGLAAGGVAYLVALPARDSGAVGRWILVQATGQANKVLATGLINSCGHGSYPGKPQADFRSCASAAAAHTQGMTLNSASFRTGDGDPAWVGCASGCCVLRPGTAPPPTE